MKKPSLAKGTRDFLPLQANRRKYIFQTIESVFKNYAYQALETPAMENLSTLTGKYGDEGDKLLFKILNSGEFLKEAPEELIKDKNGTKLIPFIAEKGLRYDLTVPFARVVAMNQNSIHFPFKRYQIQPVWRADRPQRGRYREFYQCDADVVGSSSLKYEAELIQIYDQVFTTLKIPVVIVFNHRKILEGVAKEAGCADQFMNMTLELDKLDKIGTEEVKKNLIQLGIAEDKAEWILKITASENLEDFNFNELAVQGKNELQKIAAFNSNYQYHQVIKFSASLARGLSYYTGCIFEVLPTSIKMGSLGGGGRYDNLTEVFGLSGVSGVGISFGADRIYDVLEEQNLFPTEITQAVRALFISLDEQCLKKAFELAGTIRKSGIAVEVYPESAKIKKQFSHAEKLAVPFAIILGEEEINSQTALVKNQSNGEQERVAFDSLAKYIS